MRKFRGLILLVLCFLTGFSALAQLLPRTINFTRQAYRAHNQNWMIAQGPDNKMYFGNTEGLLEFNGIDWDLYQLRDKQAVRSVVCDDQGHVFSGAFGEFGYWETGPSGKLQYHSLIDSLTREFAEKEEIWHILKGDGFILFQSFSFIFFYDYEQVRLLRPPGNIMFASEVHGELLVQVIGSGLHRFSKDGNFELLPRTIGLADKKVTGMAPMGDFEVLISTENAGLFIYSLTNEELGPWSNEAQEAFTRDQINKMVRLSNGDFVFGTILDGVYFLNTEGEVLSHIHQESSLQNNTVLSLFEDKDKNLWCGLDKGIDLIELNSPLNYFTDKTGSQGTVYAACIYEGDLYIGTNQGLFVKPWAAVNSYASGEDFSIVEGSQGQVWELNIFDRQLICGHNEGTFLVEEKKLKRISYITGGFVTVEHPARQDLLIQGTYTGLIALKKDANGQWIFSHRIEGFLEPIKQLAFGNQRKIWVANPIQGFHRLELSEDYTSVINISSFTAESGLESNFNIDICHFNDRIIFKSGERYFDYDESSGYFLPLKDSLFAIGGFKYRQFDTQGFFRIFKNKVQYHQGDQSLFLNFNMVPRYETILVLAPGLFLFCLEDGFAVLNHDHWERTTTISEPKIDLVETYGKRQNISLTYPLAEEFAFPATKNDLRFHFFHPVFIQRPALSYQLEGYDKDWYSLEGRSEKEFTNLPAGDYIFRIRNDQTGQQDEFAFSINLVWYKQPWMVLIYLGLIAGAGYVFYKLHLRRLEKERLIHEAERTRVLKEQEIRSNNEKLSLEVLNKSKELANSTMGLIRKNETLQNVKAELVKIRKAKPDRFSGKDYQRIIHLIDVQITSEHDWEIFETNFNQVHEHFFKKLKKEFPDLTPGDLKLAAYLKMNLSSKEIAPLLNISIRGVENKRYRLRKKIGLPAPENLTEFMIGY